MNVCSFPRSLRRAAVPFLGFGLILLGCNESNKEANGEESAPEPAASKQKKPAKGAEPEGASAQAAGKIISDLPDKKLVDSVVNPKNLPPYSGPTGSVKGVVRATGDEAPELPKVLTKIESSCERARSVYGVLFREGENRALADVLVAVTEYEGYVPAQDVDVKVSGQGCAWDKKTYAMTYGQRLEISGLDNRPYVPELLGQPMPAQLFVLPTAPPVKIAPKKPGRFQLVDSMRLFSVAEAYVLPYATVDVTEMDGRFEIQGIPVGEVQINALLPQSGATVGKKVTVKAGEVTVVDFELPFDRDAYDKAPKPTPLDELPAPGEGGP